MKKLYSVFKKILSIESAIDVLKFCIIFIGISVGFMFLYEKCNLIVFILASSFYCLFFLIWVCLSFNPLNSCKSKSVTNFDILLVVLSCSNLILGTLTFPLLNLIKSPHLWLFILYVDLFLVSFISIISRVCYISSNKKTNPILLSDFITDDIQLPEHPNKLFIEDKICNTDLLNRETLVEDIENSIFNYKGDSKQIIAITGKWGCGKSTLLNLVFQNWRSNSDYIFCESFDPWSYTDERSMMVDMVLRIYESIGIGAPNSRIKAMINRFVNVFMSSEKVGFLSNISFSESDDYSILHLINDYLLSNRKRLIFVIDNLDRIVPEKFYFVYQIISSTLSLERVTFICLYDEKIAEKALEKRDIDKRFLDKILSYKISVPQLKSEDIVNIGNKMFFKFINRYFPEENKLSSDDIEILNCIFECCVDLRELIILFNNTLKKLNFEKAKRVNLVDYFAISFIRFKNEELYLLIQKNAKFFVRSDLFYSSEDLFFGDENEKKKQVDIFV